MNVTGKLQFTDQRFDTLVPSSGVTETCLTKFKEVELQSFFATPWPVHQLHSLPRPSTVWMNTEIVLQILQVIVCRQPKVIKILCRSKPLFSTKRDILYLEYQLIKPIFPPRDINHTKEVMNTKVFLPCVGKDP